MTYLDRCFCIASNKDSNNKCYNEECERYFTQKHKEQASLIDLPIMWGDFYNPALGIRCKDRIGE